MSASEDVTKIYDKIVDFVHANVDHAQRAYDPTTGVEVESVAKHINDLLDDYAHALAEIIREELGIGGHRAADRIDPYGRAE